MPPSPSACHASTYDKKAEKGGGEVTKNEVTRQNNVSANQNKPKTQQQTARWKPPHFFFSFFSFFFYCVFFLFFPRAVNKTTNNTISNYSFIIPTPVTTPHNTNHKQSLHRPCRPAAILSWLTTINNSSSLQNSTHWHLEIPGLYLIVSYVIASRLHPPSLQNLISYREYHEQHPSTPRLL